MRLKRRRTRPRSCGILLVLLLMFGWFCHVLINQVRPAFWALAEIEARARTTEIIARAVTEHITKEPVLVGIERDNQGRVSLVQPNVRMINALSSGTALAIQQDMRQLSDAYIEMPLGLLSGSYFFGGTGPRLRARVLLVGTVTVDVVEHFESVGINQVRHVVLLRTSTLVRVVTPLESRNVSVETSFPVAEVVFSGEVPQVTIFPFGR